VRVATPAAFGTYLLAPRIGAFMARHPRIELELAPESRTVSLSQREADLAVTSSGPARAALCADARAVHRRVLCLAGLSGRAWQPETIADLAAHRLISYIDDLIDFPELRYLDEVAPGLAGNSAAPRQPCNWLRCARGGIGLLHEFAARDDPQLVRILPAIAPQRAYWLVVHAELRRLPRVRAVADFLDEAVRGAGLRTK
jgi:DNA-binding transcriptional LysR family regulator